MTPKLKTYIKTALMITSMTLARKPHIINTQMIPYKVKEFKSLSLSRQAIKTIIIIYYNLVVHNEFFLPATASI